ncbi:MAG: adenosylcobinamide-GDP ribazoletransferase [Pseudomonadales bacterium]|nr:adenosylcobinamide-GDP ribazoletransferase [Pseudomonadales bacterium]MCP5303540.1 adenosylcobinamide-GDP ribazoletransferase [Pseudomonadales bacterium]
MNGLLSALMLLTRLPVSAVKSVVPDTGMAVAWYPAVGLIIGCLLSLLYEVSVFAGISHLLLAALMLSLWVLVTGALHLDGLADMLDGWVGGMGDRERTLKIMKDPAVGAIGATGLMVVLLLKFAALSHLLNVGVNSIVWAVPVLGRLIALAAFAFVPAASQSGMGASVKVTFSGPRAACSVAATLVLLALFLPVKLLLFWLMAILLVFALWRRAVLRRLSGFNGDCIGALIELMELALLLVACFAASLFTEVLPGVAL